MVKAEYGTKFWVAVFWVSLCKYNSVGEDKKGALLKVKVHHHLNAIEILHSNMLLGQSLVLCVHSSPYVPTHIHTWLLTMDKLCCLVV